MEGNMLWLKAACLPPLIRQIFPITAPAPLPLSISSGLKDLFSPILYKLCQAENIFLKLHFYYQYILDYVDLSMIVSSSAL